MDTLLIDIGTLLQLPRDRKCFGYGVDPFRSGERFVIVKNIEEQLHGLLVLAESIRGETIRFAINTDAYDVYANTIDDISIVDD